MSQCLTPEAMHYFLTLTGLAYEFLQGPFQLVIHATEGDTFWTWTNGRFCYRYGISL